MSESFTSVKRRPKRLWRFEIDEVWGDVPESVKVGAHIIDGYKPNLTWVLINARLGKEVGGWHARRLEEGRKTADGRWEPINA